MAETRTIELEVKQIGLDALKGQLKEAKANAKALAKEFGETSKEAQAAAAAAGLLENKITEVREASKSLKTQLKEAQLQVAVLSEKFGATSKEATDAAKAAGILKDKIADAKDLTDAFNPDAKFNSLSRSIGGVLNGFQAYEGAMGLIGVESEDLQKTLLKVQSAMALSQGIQGALEAKDSFVQLGAVVKTAFTGMTAASKAFMVGGIGLLIGAIGLLVANWDNLTSASNKAAEEQKKLTEQTKKFNEEAKETNKKVVEESSAFVSLVYQLKRTNEGSKERSTLMKEINSKYGTTLKNLSDENEFQAQLNKSVEEYIELQYNKLKIEKNQESFDRKLAQRLELEEKQNKLLKVYREERFKEGRTITQYNYLLERQETITLKADETLEQYRNRMSLFNEDLLKVEDALQKNSDATEKIGARREKLIETDSRLTQGGKVYVEQVEKETKVVTDATEKINKNAIEGRLELKTIKEVDNLDSLDMLKEQVDAEALINREARDAETAATELALKERRQRNVDFTLQSATQMLDIIGDLAQQSEEKFKGLNAAVLNNQQTTDEQKQKLLDENNKRAKKAFEIQKAASIASTLINTYMSARSAYFSQFLPIPDPSSPIRGGIAAGLSVAGGLVAVKNIASQKFEGASMSGGGGGGGGSMGGGGTPAAPNFNIVGNSGINQLAELGGQPIQAYVVSGEVTSAQALDRNRIQNATF